MVVTMSAGLLALVILLGCKSDHALFAKCLFLGEGGLAKIVPRDTTSGRQSDDVFGWHRSGQPGSLLSSTRKVVCVSSAICFTLSLPLFLFLLFFRAFLQINAIKNGTR